eukprot:TRINITY_DN604_c1_g1_i1.p1 TRINITY_DN604_c1_g1~~TRINITY_DN604_c1_g1_i1.p1  ORF type:complete len:194 (-),score=25.68 TRINITY_DN604_c1_g1_i1:85-666(-)
MHIPSIAVVVMGIVIIILCCIPLFGVGIFATVVGGGLTFDPQEAYELLFGANSSLHQDAALAANLTNEFSNYLAMQFKMEGLSALFVAAGAIFLILAVLFLVSAVFGFAATKRSSKALMVANVILNSVICVILFAAIIWLLVRFGSFTTIDALVGNAPAWMIVVTVLPEGLLILSLIISGCWLKTHSKEVTKM